MVRDAQSMAAEDQRKKKEAEVRNTASSLIYSTEKSLTEVGDKLQDSIKSDVERALAELKRVSENGTSDQVKAATDVLQQASYKMAEALYQKAAPGPNGAAPGEGVTAGAGAAAGKPNSEDVIDAEFKEAK
jgi:molecular chaperone DnaK